MKCINSKNKFFPLLGGLIFISTVHAGDMGSAPLKARPYINGEASYNGIQANPSRINGNVSHVSSQHWGGRFAAGMLRFYTDTFAVLGELGGGYYGSKSFTNPQTTVVNTLAVDGYDALVGILYRAEYLDLFAKIGFMGENARKTIDVKNLSSAAGGDLVSGSTYTKLNDTQILPEIRVGGIYNLRENLGLTLSYLHVFGSTLSTVSNGAATLETGFYTATRVNDQNPTLNSVFLGLHYYIA